MLRIPGIKKYKLIEKTFAMSMRLVIEPSKESVNTYESMLSMIPKSFENLLFSRPLGVTSKYEQGLLTSPWIILLWIYSLEFKITTFKKKDFYNI